LLNWGLHGAANGSAETVREKEVKRFYCFKGHLQEHGFYYGLERHVIRGAAKEANAMVKRRCSIFT